MGRWHYRQIALPDRAPHLAPAAPGNAWPPVSTDARCSFAGQRAWDFWRRCHTMPAADFCRAISRPYEQPSLDSKTPDSSPEVSSTAFITHLPDLPPRYLMAMDFAVTCPLVLPGRPHLWFLSVRSCLLHVAFRPRLTTVPLRFANPSPPSGWVEDFHLRAVEHARHTRKRRALGAHGVGRLSIDFSRITVRAEQIRRTVSKPVPSLSKGLSEPFDTRLRRYSERVYDLYGAGR